MSTTFLLSLPLVLAAEVVPRDAHGHHHSHAAPLTELNETELTLYHSPTPPSYYTIDWDDPDPTGNRHPSLMLTHAAFMSLAFFVALPAAIALRSVKHPWRSAAMLAFYGLCALGCASSSLYRKWTPNMYEGQVHSQHGYFVILLALGLSAVDIVQLLRRIVSYVRTSDKYDIISFYRTAILGHTERPHGTEAEHTGLVADDVDLAESKIPASPSSTDTQPPFQKCYPQTQTARWANEVHHHRRDYSLSAASEPTLYDCRPSHSDDTLQEDELRTMSHIRPRLAIRIMSIAYSLLERSLVFAGFAVLLTGIVTYTGGCRENYENGCLAHLIKGGIFWCYGLFTFARFLGSHAELGWAWNRAPAGNPVSGEFVESLVIFAYGITNTWMERFGANRGDPYTTKQIQHISIAVMFWFAGLVGMGIESRRVRRWLASSPIRDCDAHSHQTSHGTREAVAEPPSYAASFNPFPALVIGVTGAAMAAHFQTYLFQVQIHALWGNLLLGFSVMRCLTYFFLWLAPPRSTLPSRPPTEALGAFFLACGGLVFMFSTEELTIAAMRRGRDDVMMFLNVAVAITCCALSWTLGVVSFKGWLKARSRPAVNYHSSA